MKLNWVGRLQNRKGWVFVDAAIHSQVSRVKEEGKKKQNMTPDPGSGLF